MVVPSQGRPVDGQKASSGVDWPRRRHMVTRLLLQIVGAPIGPHQMRVMVRAPSGVVRANSTSCRIMPSGAKSLIRGARRFRGLDRRPVTAYSAGPDRTTPPRLMTP